MLPPHGPLWRARHFRERPTDELLISRRLALIAEVISIPLAGDFADPYPCLPRMIS
jgi:hypothetical protein